MARNIFWGVSPSPLFPFSPPLSSPFFFVAKQPHSKCSCRIWGTLQAPPAGFEAETKPKTLFGVYRAPRNELSDCRCCSKRLICVALFYGQFLSLSSVIFRATNANPQPAVFGTTNIWWNATLPSVRCKSFAFYKVVRLHFSDVVHGQRGNSLFSSDVT